MPWSGRTGKRNSPPLLETGTYRISELEVGQEGLIAQIQRGGGTSENNFNNCPLTGRIAGVRPY
jgi:hypothetical protein